MGPINDDATTTPTAGIPIVDFAALMQSSAQELKRLDEGFSTFGFVYLTNHSVPSAMVAEAFEWSRKLFALPLETKLKARHPKFSTVGDHRGYCARDIGHTTQYVFNEQEIGKSKEERQENKETFETGNPEAYSEAAPNRWIPDEDLPGFQAFHGRWWKEMVDCCQQLLGACGHALGLEDPDMLRKMQSKNDAHVSLMFYPRMPITPLKSRQANRLNEHSDYGDLTILFQDQVGGLEVHDGIDYRPVIPKPGTIILNVGDMLERMTNGRWKSALHRVSAPSEETLAEGYHPNSDVVDRYAIAFFGQPDPDVVIDRLPGLESKPGRWPTKLSDWADRPTSYQWLQKRYTAEFHGYQTAVRAS